MSAERVLLIGHMARDDALAAQLEGAELNVMGVHENPGLKHRADASGGVYYQTSDLTNGEVAAAFALDREATIAIVTGDDPLAAGVVDKLRAANPDLKIVGPEQIVARIEWDKFFSRDVIEEINPELNPRYHKAQSESDVVDAVCEFSGQGLEVAVKPRNPTGGKGVKVMGPHLNDYDEARSYAYDVLDNPKQTGVLIEEKLVGHEFTLQILTDGNTIITPPVTYDYPYRYDGDTGPGTGGMGSFSFKPGELPPFLHPEDYQQALDFSKKLLQSLPSGSPFNGVLYPSFIMTREGLKVIEINARPGDPEMMNIMESFEDDVDGVDVFRRIATGELREADVRYRKLASAVIYFASPLYCVGEDARPIDFTLDMDMLADYDVRPYFSAAERIASNDYRTVGHSRAVALAARGETPWEARGKILPAYASGMGGPLDYREQVAQKEYIESLKDPRRPHA